MREERGNIFSNIDGIVFFTWLALVISGIFAIYSATSEGNFDAFLSLSGKHARQAIFFGIAFMMMLVILSLDYDFLMQSSPFIYIATLILLALTLVIGSEINGSKSWIKLGGFQIQPAEFAKTGTSLMLAYWFYFQEKVFENLKKAAITFTILFLPMALILLQGDMGSMLTFCILIFVFYREGLSPLLIYLGIAGITISLTTLVFGFPTVAVALLILAIVLFIIFRKMKGFWKPLSVVTVIAILSSLSVTKAFDFLKGYQQDRVLILLGLKEDLHGAGYNLWQSKMAIGSGKFLGKGYLQGVQTQGDFIPEVSTDYIFANIGEEWGFAGGLFVVGLFTILVFRILFLAERQKSRFSRVFLYCAAGFFTIHTFINIGMVIGIFPTAGIPLPFFSYGGSSLLSFTLIISLVLRFNAEQSSLLS